MTHPDPSSTSSDLSGRQLRVRYRKDQQPILDDLSVEIPTGKVTALIGANGSGKSTLLKTFARQLSPFTGSVLLNGKDIAALTQRQIARDLGILFQENIAPSGLTVESLVRHGRFPHQKMFEPLTDDDHRAVDRALQLTGITTLRHHAIDQLSGGQKQLAWIALVLAQQTGVLLLDEPTTFLDMRHQLEVMQVVTALRRQTGITIVMVLHDVNQAARYSDHLIALRDGRIIDQGPPQQVLTPRLLHDVYQIDAEVIRTSDDVPVCVPRGLADGA